MFGDVTGNQYLGVFSTSVESGGSWPVGYEVTRRVALKQTEDRWVLGDNYKITKLKVQNDQLVKRSKEICSDGRQS